MLYKTARDCLTSNKLDLSLVWAPEENYPVLSQTLTAGPDNVSLKGREKVLTRTLPVWEADPFVMEQRKAGKNIHSAVIRMAELESDEQAYLSFVMMLWLHESAL